MKLILKTTLLKDQNNLFSISKQAFLKLKTTLIENAVERPYKNNSLLLNT
jgi:hypothetical protein